MNTVLVPMLTGAEVTFWVTGPLAILGALGLVLSRRAVYAALSMAVSMICLAALYASVDGPFLAMTQIIVYTGAVMMMFLFVLMMVGVDKTDSAVETLAGQRLLAVAGGLALAGLLIGGILTGFPGSQPVTVTEANAQFGGNVQGLASLMFGRYIFVFLLSAALLITAAVGAMLLAHHERVHPKKGQVEQAAERMRGYADRGEHPGSLPNSGVFATTNAIGAPALLPDGSVAEKSLSEALVARGAMLDPTPLQQITQQTFAAIEAVENEEDQR